MIIDCFYVSLFENNCRKNQIEILDEINERLEFYGKNANAVINIESTDRYITVWFKKEGVI